jgi:hypothetical protein
MLSRMPTPIDAAAKIVSVPDLYRFVRNEVPGGKLLAPLVAWLLLGAAIVWAGSVIWNGVGLPVLLAARGGVSALPTGQWASSALALGLFVITLFLLDRMLKRILQLFGTISLEANRVSQDILNIQGESIATMKEMAQHTHGSLNNVLEEVRLLDKRITALEGRQSPQQSTHDQ